MHELRPDAAQALTQPARDIGLFLVSVGEWPAGRGPMATRIEAQVAAESDRYSAIVIAEPIAYVEGGERVLRVELEIRPKQKGQE